jgi:hypothetical protein
MFRSLNYIHLSLKKLYKRKSEDQVWSKSVYEKLAILVGDKSVTGIEQQRPKKVCKRRRTGNCLNQVLMVALFAFQLVSGTKRTI